MSGDRRVASRRSELWIVVSCVLVFCVGQLVFVRLGHFFGSRLLYGCFLWGLVAPLYWLWILPRDTGVGWLEFAVLGIAVVGLAQVPRNNAPWWLDGLVSGIAVYACLKLAKVVRHCRRAMSSRRPQEHQATTPPSVAGPAIEK